MGAVACAPLQPPLIASSSGGQQHRRASSSAGSMLSAGLKRELETAAASSAEAGPVAAATASRETAESAPASISQHHHLHHHQQQQQQQQQQPQQQHPQQPHPHASTTSLPSSTAAASSIIHQRLPDRQRMNGHELPAASQPAFRPAQGSPTSTSTSTSTATSTSTRIKVRDLSHIQSFASEEAAAGSSQHRPGGLQRQYEISSMPVADVIEMVAGLLTKITTTNDRQHEHLHRHIPRAEQRSLPPQTTSVLAFHGKNVPGITILNYLSRIHKYCPTTYEVFISLLVYFDRMTETVNSHLLQQMHRRAHLRPNPSIRTMSTSSSNRPHTSSSSPFFSPANANPNTNTNTNNNATISRRFSSRRSTETSIARVAVSKQHLPPTSPVDHPMRSPSVQDEHDQEAEHDLSDSDDDLSDVSDELNFSHFLVVDSYNIHRLVIAGVTCASKFFSDVFYTNSRYAKVGGLPLIELNHLELQFLLLNDFRLAVPVEELEAYGTMLVQFYARELVAQQQQQQQQQQQHQQQQGTPQPGSNATATSAMQHQGDPPAQNDRFTPTHT